MAITEAQIRNATLPLLAQSPNGFLSTSDLIAALEGILRPTGKDAEIVPGRSDTYFSQKVRNMVCHREGSTSLQTQGYVIYDEVREGLEITDVGRASGHKRI